MRLTWLKFHREFALNWLSFQNESTGQQIRLSSAGFLGTGTNQWVRTQHGIHPIAWREGEHAVCVHGLCG
jgi:hypothetical protein